ncbi:hypothetical protein Tco_0391510, partial [Tanacetum coccineum]
LQRHPFYCTLPTATDAVIPDPTPEELAVSSPSAKVIAKVKLPRSKKPLLLVLLRAILLSVPESDDDDGACYEILVVTPIRSTAVITPSRNQGEGSGALLLKA